ncbi:MAG: hypothetical protein ACTSR2_10975, partial [Candidatus Hodarchaeales archaeon]
FERGIESIKSESWFDSLQLLQGALQRSIRSNSPKMAEKIFLEAIPLYKEGNRENLACSLALYYIRVIGRDKLKEIKWINLIEKIIIVLNKSSLTKCIREFINNIIIEKKFLDDNILNLMDENLQGSLAVPDVKINLSYCLAGLYSANKDYVACFTTLDNLAKETALTPILRTYLTLAEINAFELEGCGKYLQNIIENLDQREEMYIEIAQRAFQAVESFNYNEYESIRKEYSDIINPKFDAILKSLFDGIGEIFQSSRGANVFSSFFKP